MLAVILLEDGGIRLLALAAVVGLGVVLASKRSTYLIDLFLYTVCFNRLFRRLMDWSEGQYDEQPLSSIAAPALACLMVIAVISDSRRLPIGARRAGMLIIGALVYGTVVGAGNQLASLFTLLDYVMPFGVLFYSFSLGINRIVYERWIRTLSTLAVIVAAYGMVQWAIVPPWDVAWVNWSEMWSSMGKPIPYNMSVCSTLESRGPFAWFMATAAVPMCLNSRWRRPVGIAGLLLVVLGAILSTARTSWGFLAGSLALYPVLLNGRGLFRVGVLGVVTGLAIAFILPRLPGNERLVARMETLTNLSSDGSFQGRLTIAQEGISAVLSRPQGYGFGSTGVGASRLGGNVVSGDNGYIDLLVDFGVPGFLMLFGGLWMIVAEAIRRNRLAPSEEMALPLAMLGSGLVFLVIGNWVSGPYGAMIFMLLGGALGGSTLPGWAPDRRAHGLRPSSVYRPPVYFNLPNAK